MFDLLRKELEKHYKEEIKKTLKDIEENENSMKYYLTENSKKKYESGLLPLATARKKATKKANAETLKYANEKLQKLEKAENAEEIEYIRIIVEWHGYTPTATVRTGCGIYESSAHGWGYDKESAAVGSAFNQSAEIMRILYTRAEKVLAENEEPYKSTGCGNCITWRESLGYGSGYNILPYFEGGVGVSCFWDILSRCGYKLKNHESGKKFDTYYLEREAV